MVYYLLGRSRFLEELHFCNSSIIALILAVLKDEANKRFEGAGSWFRTVCRVADGRFHPTHPIYDNCFYCMSGTLHKALSILLTTVALF